MTEPDRVHVGQQHLQYADQYWVGTITNFTNLETKLPHHCRFDPNFNIGQDRGSKGHGGCKERLKRDFTFLLNERMRNITFMKPESTYPFSNTITWWTTTPGMTPP